MLQNFYNQIGTASPAGVIIAVAFMLATGFLMTRLTGLLRLQNVTAYILAGVLLGPNCLALVPANVVSGTGFLADIALAFIAFSVGEFFRMETRKKNGGAVLVITLMESLVASLVVFVVTYVVLHLSLAFSIVLAALASATAPASTIMTIRQTNAKGDLVETLLQVVALDDMVALLAFSISTSIALASLHEGQADICETILYPFVRNAGVMLLGGVFGILLHLIMGRKHSTDNRLIIALSVIFAFCGAPF